MTKSYISILKRKDSDVFEEFDTTLQNSSVLHLTYLTRHIIKELESAKPVLKKLH